MARESLTRLPSARPAETAGGLAGAVAVLVAYFAGIDDPGAVSALVLVVAAVPALVTWVVELRRRKA